MRVRVRLVGRAIRASLYVWVPSRHRRPCHASSQNFRQPREAPPQLTGLMSRKGRTLRSQKLNAYKLPTPLASRKNEKSSQDETSQKTLQRRSGKWKTAAECQRRSGRRQGPRNLLYEDLTASGRLHTVAVKNRDSGPSLPLGDFDRLSGSKDQSRAAKTHKSLWSAFSFSFPQK